MNCLKYLSLSHLLLLILSPLFVQSTNAQYKFEATYGGYSFERGTTIKTTIDGGYIITGSSSSFSSDQDPFLIKIDKYSNILWSKVYHLPGYEEKLHGVVQAANGEYYVVGYFEGGFGVLDDLFMKVDSVGNIIWAKNLGGGESDEFRDVCITPDGRILAVGQNASFGAGAKDYPVVKFTSDGNIEWAKAYGNIWEEFGGTIVLLDDGNYGFSGATDISGYYDVRPLLFKTDSLGNLMWSKIYQGYLEDWGRYAIKTQSGGFLLLGDTKSYGLGGSMDIYLINTDSDGNVVWAKAYGGTEDESARSAVQDNEGNYVIAGYTYSFGLGGSDAFLMKITPNGDLLWFYTYGGFSNDYAFRLAPTPDSGYVMTGGNSSNSLGNEDILLVKVDKFGSSGCQNGPFNPNVFNISNLTAINYNLYTSNYISYADIQLSTITPNTAQNFICGIVPVELKSFNYQFENHNVVLEWKTATEINNHGFEVERKANEGEWITIGFVEGKGTSTETLDYKYVDDLFGVNSKKVFYRLKQIDFNGQFEYSSEVEVNIPPAVFRLEQNFPNPFNPSTKIRFGLPVEAYTSLRIYNFLGECVEELLNEVREAGYYEVEFNTDNLSSGIYFYSLISGKFQETKKMMLLK